MEAARKSSQHKQARERERLKGIKEDEEMEDETLPKQVSHLPRLRSGSVQLQSRLLTADVCIILRATFSIQHFCPLYVYHLGRDCRVLTVVEALQEPVAFAAGSSKDGAVNRRSSSFDGWLSSGPKPTAPSKAPPSSTSSKAATADAEGEARDSSVHGQPGVSRTLTRHPPGL